MKKILSGQLEHRGIKVDDRVVDALVRGSQISIDDESYKLTGGQLGLNGEIRPYHITRIEKPPQNWDGWDNYFPMPAYDGTDGPPEPPPRDPFPHKLWEAEEDCWALI